MRRAAASTVSADLLVRLPHRGADVLTGRYLTGYDDLDDLLSRTAEIQKANRYTLGLLQPDR
jgi:hypothetical protein